MNRPKGLIFICFVFLAVASYGQSDSIWYRHIDMAGIKFRMPKGYIEKDTAHTFYPNFVPARVFIMEKLYSEDSCIMIGCYCMPFEYGKKTVEAAKLFNQVFDPNKNCQNHIKSLTASDSTRVQHFFQKKQLVNAIMQMTLVCLV